VLFKEIATYLDTFVESFKNVLETAKATKGTPFRLSRFSCCLQHPETSFFEGSFHLRKEENAIKKMGIVLTSLDEIVA
jgi:hypothetical protein